MMSALLLVPDQAPPVAFAAGVLGPIIGADLLHLRDVSKISTGIASIGDTGTVDGTVFFMNYGSPFGLNDNSPPLFQIFSRNIQLQV